MQYAAPQALEARILQRRSVVHPFAELYAVSSALVVIDMQVAFLADGYPCTIPGAREVVPTINRLADAVRNTGGTVIWIVSTYGPHEKDRAPVLFGHLYDGSASQRLREALSEGAEGHAIWPGLQRSETDLVISKNRTGAFFGSDGKLLAALKARSIENVLVAGTVTSVCCDTTAREASMLDFKTTMVCDANAGRSEGEDWQTYTNFIQSFGDVMGSAEVIAALQKAGIPR